MPRLALGSTTSVYATAPPALPITLSLSLRSPARRSRTRGANRMSDRAAVSTIRRKGWPSTSRLTTAYPGPSSKGTEVSAGSRSPPPLPGAVLKANRFTMEEPIGVHQRTKRNHCFPLSQVGKGLDYRLIKELWAFTGNRITVRCAYEWHDDSGHWYIASMAMENWEFNDDGLMALRFASINDFPILKSGRKYH